MENKNNIYRIIVINLFILLAFIILSELGMRVLSTLKECLYKKCDFTYVTQLNISTEKKIGLYSFDKTVGYSHKKNFKYFFKDDNLTISTNDKGFRNNKKIIKSTKLTILALGCSFTFGDQVSDGETWPSYLEENLNIQVDNAGVNGYGTAQALLLGQNILKTNKYNTVILSTLVGSDFIRDQMIYRSGFPKPSFVKIKDIVNIEFPPVDFMLGSKFNPHKVGVTYFLNDYSKLYNYFGTRIFGNQNRGLLDKVNPKAAKVEDIIDWTFKKLNSMKVKNKVLLLQYSKNENSIIVMKEREMLIKKAKVYNFIVIDTLPILKKINPKILWQGHHTPVGNKIVSKIIANKLKVKAL